MANATTYNIELRDKNGYLRQYLTPFVKTPPTWEWNRLGGCGRCSIKLKMDYRKIEFGAHDDIQIRIKSGATSKLVYRGFISQVIPSLKTDQEISLDVKGYIDCLDKIAIQSSGDKKTYANQLVSQTVTDIVDDFIVAKTNITKGTIDGSSFVADMLEFKTTVTEALKTLAELEGRVEYGVDENLVFYWRNQNSTLRHKFFVGNNVESFERRVDWSKLVNKIYFEGGEVGGVKYLTTAEAQDSQTSYFLAEKIVNNSSIVTSSVANQYLGSTLREYSSPQLILKMKIPNTDLRLEDTLPLGEIAVYDPDYDEDLYIIGEAGDGGDDITVGERASGGSNVTIGALFQDQIDKITYTTSETEEKFNIEITLGGSILETAAKIKQLELLLSQVRQNQ